MKNELQLALVRDFPRLYAGVTKPLTQSLMAFGFECGDGWEPLIRELSRQLTQLNEWEGAECEATQVKEKYGTLSFYVTSATDIQYACISHAESLSECRCETCGAYGTTASYQGWVSTLCALHWEQLKHDRGTANVRPTTANGSLPLPADEAGTEGPPDGTPGDVE